MTQEHIVRLLLIIASVGRGSDVEDGKRALKVIVDTGGSGLKLNEDHILALATGLAAQTLTGARVADDADVMGEVIKMTDGTDVDVTDAWPVTV